MTDKINYMAEVPMPPAATFDGKDAWGVVRDLLKQRDMLHSAMRAVMSGDEFALRCFAEDHGMRTDLDPIRKTDVIKHALAQIDEWRAQREQVLEAGRRHGGNQAGQDAGADTQELPKPKRRAAVAKSIRLKNRKPLRKVRGRQTRGR